MPTRTSRTGRLEPSAAELAFETARNREFALSAAQPVTHTVTQPVTQCEARLGDTSQRLQSGFTLIEIMAVVLIMGLSMALVLPNLSWRQHSALRDQAIGIASQLELARQLAVVTGKPHRMLIDLESGAYRLEWFGEQSPRPGEEDEEPADPYDLAYREVDLAPPMDDNLAYSPIDGRFGDDSFLDADFFFEGLETAEGWFDSGEIMLVFYRDGTTDAAELVIADDYDNAIVLEVRPLLDTIRIIEDES